MKKIRLLLPLAFITILAACGFGKNEVQQVPINNESEVMKETVDDERKSSEQTEGEQENQSLETIGQKRTLEDGTIVELKKINKVDETIELGPLNLYIKDIKLLSFSNISNEYEQELLRYTELDKFDGEVNFIQIMYTAENITDDKIGWQRLNKVILNNGQQLDVYTHDFIRNYDLDSSFYGNVKKEGVIGVIFKGKPEEITHIKIVTKPIYNPDTIEVIAKEVQTEFEF